MTEDKDIIPFYSIFCETRKSQDISLNDIAEKTKINIKYLEAIENGDFDILPFVYIRLFLKTYSEILNLDVKNILEEYEKHTNTKPLKVKTKITQPKIVEKDSNDIKAPKPKAKTNFNFKLNDDFKNYFYSPGKIFSIIFAIISIVCIYLIISFLSKEQLKNNMSNPSNYSDVKAQTTLVDSLNTKLKFNIESPYVFQITTKSETKIKINYKDQNLKDVTLIDGITKGGNIYKTPRINSIVYFEISNSENVQASINTYPINRYLKSKKNTNDDNIHSIIGSYNPGNNVINIKYFQN